MQEIQLPVLANRHIYAHCFTCFITSMSRAWACINRRSTQSSQVKRETCVRGYVCPESGFDMCVLRWGGATMTLGLYTYGCCEMNLVVGIEIHT